MRIDRWQRKEMKVDGSGWAIGNGSGNGNGNGNWCV